jgi:hypothetical protein
VTDAYMEGIILQMSRRTSRRRSGLIGGLRPEETAVVRLLGQRIDRSSKRPKAA